MVGGSLMSAKTEEYLQSVVRELVKMPDEVEWVEFKCNNKDPERMQNIFPKH